MIQEVEQRAITSAIYPTLVHIFLVAVLYVASVEREYSWELDQEWFEAASLSA